MAVGCKWASCPVLTPAEGALPVGLAAELRKSVGVTKDGEVAWGRGLGLGGARLPGVPVEKEVVWRVSMRRGSVEEFIEFGWMRAGSA